MPGSLSLPLTVLMAGVLLVLAGGGALRWSGARAGVGRRLAAARQVRVADLLTEDPPPARPVRVVGRIRCADPILTAQGDRLVALHRDVEVRMARGGWRTIERRRETRGFELWDHGGSLAIDPAAAAEPLVVIPHVWRGDPAELGAEHRAALARLTAEGGDPGAARSVTRTLSVVERLLVLAAVRRAADGTISLFPPPGGYVISALELDDAMRLLGGPRRGLLLPAAAAIGVGALLTAVGAVLAAATLVSGI
jgi:hypothetical protein